MFGGFDTGDLDDGRDSASGIDPAYANNLNRRINLLQTSLPELDAGSIYGLASDSTDDDEMLAGALSSVSLAQWAQQAADLKVASPERQRATWASMSEEQRMMVGQFGFVGPATDHDSDTPAGKLVGRSLDDPTLRLDLSRMLGRDENGPLPDDVGDVVGLAAQIPTMAVRKPAELAMSGGGQLLDWMHTAGDTFAGRPSRTAADMAGDEQFARFHLRLEQAKQNLRDQGVQLSDEQWTGMLARIYDDTNVSFEAWDRYRRVDMEGIDPYGDQEFAPVDDAIYSRFVAEAERLRTEEEYDLSASAAWQRTATGEQYIKPSAQIEAQAVLKGDGLAFDIAHHLAIGKSVEDFVENVQGISQTDQGAFDAAFAEVAALAASSQVNEAVQIMADGKSSLGREWARRVGLDPEEGVGMLWSGATDLTAVLTLDPLLFAGKLGKGVRAYRWAKNGVDAIEETHQLARAHRALQAGDRAGALEALRLSRAGFTSMSDDLLDTGRFLHNGEVDAPLARLFRDAAEAEGIQGFEMGALLARGEDGQAVATRLLREHPEDLRRVITRAEQMLAGTSARAAKSGLPLRGGARLQTKLGQLRTIVDDVEFLDVDNISPLMRWRMADADRQLNAADRLARTFVEHRAAVAAGDRSVTPFVSLIREMPGSIRAIDPLLQADSILRARIGRGFETGDDIMDWYKTVDGMGALNGRRFGNHAIPDAIELPRLRGGVIGVGPKFTTRKIEDAINFAADGRVVVNLGGRSLRAPFAQGGGRFLKALTNQQPLARTMPFWGDDLGQNAIAEARNLVRMGSFVGVDTATQNRYLEDFITGVMTKGGKGPRLTIAGRMEVHRNLLVEMFDAAGIRNLPRAEEWADDLVARLNHRYAANDLDVIATSGGDQMRVPIFPVAQWSDQAAIPDFAGLLANTQRTSFLSRTALGSVNNRMIDAFMGTWWKPIMLLKLGFIPRAAGEEMLGFFARIGSRDFMDAYMGKISALGGESKLVDAADHAIALRPLRVVAPNASWNVANLRALPDEAFRYQQLMTYNTYREWRDGMYARYLAPTGDTLRRMDRYAGFADFWAARASRSIQRAAFRMASDDMQLSVLLTTVARGRDYANLADLYRGENLAEDLLRSANQLFQYAAVQRVHADLGAAGLWHVAMRNDGEQPFSTIAAGRRHFFDGNDPTNILELRVFGSRWVDQVMDDSEEARAAMFGFINRVGSDPLTTAWADAVAGTLTDDALRSLGNNAVGRYVTPANANVTSVIDRTLPTPFRIDWQNSTIAHNPRLVMADYGTWSLMDDSIWRSLNIDPDAIRASFATPADYHAFLYNAQESLVRNRFRNVGRFELQVAYTDAWGGIPDHAIYGLPGTTPRVRIARHLAQSQDTSAEFVAVARRLEEDIDALRTGDVFDRAWVESFEYAQQGAGHRASFLRREHGGRPTPYGAVNDAQVDAYLDSVDPRLRRRWEEVKADRGLGDVERTAADDVFMIPTLYALQGRTDEAERLTDMLRTLDAAGPRVTHAVLADTPVRIADDLSPDVTIDAVRSALQHPDLQPYVRDQMRRFVTSDGRWAATNPQAGERTFYGVMADQRVVDAIGQRAASPRAMTEMLTEMRALGLTDNDAAVVERMMGEWDTASQQAFTASRHYDDLDLIPVSHVAVTDDDVAERIGVVFQQWAASKGVHAPVTRAGYVRRLDDSQMDEYIARATLWDLEDAPIPMYGLRPDQVLNNMEPIDHTAPVVRFDDHGLPDPAGPHVRRGASEQEVLDDWAKVADKALRDIFVREGEVVHELIEPIRRGRFDYGVVDNIADSALPRRFVAPMRYADTESLWQRGIRYGFDNIVGPAIGSLVRKPMFLLEVRNGLRAAQPMADAMRNPRLYEEAATRLGLVDRHLDDAREAWMGVPEELRHYIGTDISDLTLSARTRPDRLAERRRQAQQWFARNVDEHPLNATIAGWSDAEFDVFFRVMRHDEHVHQRVMDTVLDGAHRNMFRYIDDHRIRSFFQGYARNLMPFMFAQEQFLKRWARILAHSPEAMRRAQLLGHGVLNSGFTHEDEYGQPQFYIPGSEHLQEWMANAPVLSALFGGGARVPISVPLTGTITQTLPGVGPNALDMPGVSPILSVPLGAAVNHFPELRALQEGLVGDMAESKTIWNDLAPVWLTRTVRSVFADETDREVNASMISAMQMMEAEAIRLRAEGDEHLDAGDVDAAAKAFDRAAQLSLPDDSTDADIEAYLDEVRNWSRSVLATRAVFSFVSPAPVKPEFDGMTLNREFIELLEHMEFSEALAVFLAEHPDAGPYAVFESETQSPGATLPVTTAALDWMDENRTTLEQFPLAAPWLMPQDREGNEFSRAAYNNQVAYGLRQRKSPEQWYRDLKYMAAAETYFASRRRYQTALASAPDPATRAELERAYSAWADQYKAQHPIFATSLNTETRTKRLQALDELRMVLEDPDGPSSPHKAGLVDMVQSYDAFAAALGRYDGDQSKDGRLAREQLKAAFAAWGAKYVAENPEVGTFWSAMIEPLADVRDDAQVATQTQEDDPLATLALTLGG